MVSPTTRKGARGEQLAGEYLQKEGYRILERNYRCRRGEIDIIADEGGVICIVEVRSRESSGCGDPLESVNHPKRSRIIYAARRYLAARGLTERDIRFDVVGITYQPELRIHLVRGAFESASVW